MMMLLSFYFLTVRYNVYVTCMAIYELNRILTTIKSNAKTYVFKNEHTIGKQIVVVDMIILHY